ncbi:cytosolic fructose-1,6-bisphosphatase [Ectocarpus siliculosus]|uniref:Fructose-1,6-bisphosphatase, cytosolic n=1 Tax=Ectocarpus siliculosus TaxID=2880 RepID=D7FK80_ECTSI|nr:cytosolic fructose-1,6-bisphosphatase [Ectocarpus siliculosus]|eukprot:CBJ29285.1 cytosolic fructose-1,6-bisphosphatase [Ectocarpus siliculosus]
MASNPQDPDRVDQASTPTLSAFVMKSTGDQELAILMHSIALCCKSITRAVRKAGIAGLYGLAGTDNSSGDHVKKLDILSNDIMISALTESHMCAVLVSEENEDPIIIEDSKSDKAQNIYSCNEGNFDSWDEEIKRAVMGFKTESPPWAQRYVGSMVSDVHRTLLYGGLFLYPADKKSTKGKLRVLYEGFPMALIIEQAGGSASTGMFNGSIGRVLEITPKDIHERCPIIIGNPPFVERVLDEYKKA